MLKSTMAFSCKGVLVIIGICFFQLSRSQIPPDYGPCKIGRYGDKCNQNCNTICAGPCNVTNGDCLFCRGLYAVPNCTDCIENLYGPRCELECSETCASSYEGRGVSILRIRGCNRTNGICTYGCRSRWYGLWCDYQCPGRCADFSGYGAYQCERNNGSCPRGCWNDEYYGEFCDKHCSIGCYDSICAQYTGECSPCHLGYKGASCQECEDNYFLKAGCTHCGHCANGTSCSNITGICPAGCQLGWRGEECSVCDHGFYGNGDNCTACGHCEIGMTCDNITGQCPTGCQMRWQGAKCDVCDNGFYGNGDNCTACGHCEIGMTCDNITGLCPTGCQMRWQGAKCDECSAGYYGANCSEQCGHCQNNDICLPSNGVCVHGCKREFDGDTCKECSAGYYGANCSEQCGHCRNNDICLPSNGVCVYGCKREFDGDTCKDCKTGMKGDNCSYPCGYCGGDGSCAKQNGECFYGCRSGWEGKECLNKTILQAEDLEDHTWIIAGSVIGVGVLITCAIIVSVMVWLQKRRAASEIDEAKKNNPNCLTSELQHSSEMNIKKDSSLESEKVEESTYDRLEVYEITDEEVKPYTHFHSSSHLTSFMEGDLPSAHYDGLTIHYQNSTENGKPYEALAPGVM